MKNTLKTLLAAGFVSAGIVGFVGCTSSDACKPCEKTACEKAACPKANCPKADCPKKATCPKTNCPKAACPKVVSRSAVGCWAIQKPGAYWLGICNKDGKPTAKLLWGGGSPNEQSDVKIDGATATMKQCVGRNKEPAKARYRVTTLKSNGACADITLVTTDGTGKELGRETLKAKRIPALPPAPDLSKIEYGTPVNLLADGLNGWQSKEPKNYFGWSFKDGVLSNRIKRTADGKRDGASANLITKRADFFDFKISYDVRVLPGCNSGVYLRGIYELQVLDSYGRPVDCHHMAAFYGRITPSVAAEKPAGEWQHVDAILYNRHITVVLNGKKIIDNQPVYGCTGGAITNDEFVKGPFYLQGDHSDADFRNIIVTPIVK